MGHPVNVTLVKISTHCAKLETSLAQGYHEQNGSGALKI